MRFTVWASGGWSRRRTDHGRCRRIVAAHGRRVADGDVEGLGQLAALGEQIEQATAAAVRGLRKGGYSWTDIATRLGITRQAAQQRWGSTAVA